MEIISLERKEDNDLKILKSSAVVGMSIKLPPIRQAPLLVLLTNNRNVNHMRVGIRFYFYYLRIMEKLPVYWPPFFTATILEWKSLLKPDKYKEIIISSLQYLTANKQITLYAFVIMNNHIHLIWQALPGKTPEQVQHSFMKYTAQQIKFDLVENHPQVLDKFRVNVTDRTYLPMQSGLGKEFIGY